MFNVITLIAQYCNNPTLPSFGQSYDWDQSQYDTVTPYAHKVKYTCQTGMLLQSNIPGEDKLEEQTLTCGWDKEWHPTAIVRQCKHF